MSNVINDGRRDKPMGKVVYVFARQQEEGCWNGDYAVARTPTELFAKVAELYPTWNRYEDEDYLNTDKTFVFNETFVSAPDRVYILFFDGEYPRVDLIASDSESFIERAKHLYPDFQFLHDCIADFCEHPRLNSITDLTEEHWIALVDLNS